MCLYLLVIQNARIDQQKELESLEKKILTHDDAKLVILRKDFWKWGLNHSEIKLRTRVSQIAVKVESVV